MITLCQNVFFAITVLHFSVILNQKCFLLFRNGDSALKLSIKARVNDPERVRDNLIIVQHLVDNGASLTSLDKDGLSPLQLAQHWKRDDLCPLLDIKR